MEFQIDHTLIQIKVMKYTKKKKIGVFFNCLFQNFDKINSANLSWLMMTKTLVITNMSS